MTAFWIGFFLGGVSVFWAIVVLSCFVVNFRVEEES